MDLQIIGTIYNNDAEFDELGNLTKPATAKQGFHVNSCSKLIGLNGYLVTPEAPYQVFYGVTTYFYTFESEAQAKELIGFDDGQYAPDFEPVVIVPTQVTRRQAITVLTLAGYITTIESALAAIEDPTQKVVAEVFWKDSLHFERNNPVLNQLATNIGMTQEQLDELFIQASNI